MTSSINNKTLTVFTFTPSDGFSTYSYSYDNSNGDDKIILVAYGKKTIKEVEESLNSEGFNDTRLFFKGIELECLRDYIENQEQSILNPTLVDKWVADVEVYSPPAEDYSSPCEKNPKSYRQ